MTRGFSPVPNGFYLGGAGPFPGSTRAAHTGPVSSWLTSVFLAADGPLCTVWGGQPRGLEGHAGGLQGPGSGRGITSLWDLAVLGPLQQPALLSLVLAPRGQCPTGVGAMYGEGGAGRGQLSQTPVASFPGALWDNLETSLASGTPWSQPAPRPLCPSLPAPGLLSCLPTPQSVTGGP